MDWIQKLEEEKRVEQQRQAQTQAAKLKRESEDGDRFRIVKNKLCPIIEDAISDLKKRTGFELQMNVGDTSLIVRAPHPEPKKEFRADGAWRYVELGRISDHRFEISSISNDGKTVRIEAIRAGLTNRNPDGWEESDMSSADYFGTDETVINTINDLDRLVSEDIHLLLEWLVRQQLGDRDIVPPELSSMRQRKEQKQAALFKARGGLACGLAGFFLMFAHPVFALLGTISIYAGLRAKSELSTLGMWSYGAAGRGSAKWAIGLGIWESFVLIVTILLKVVPMGPA